MGIVDAALYILSYTDLNLDEFDFKAFSSFAEAEKQLKDGSTKYFNPAQKHLSSWTMELFNVHENNDKMPARLPQFPLELTHDSTYEFVPLSLPQLKQIVNTLMLISRTSFEQHFQPDTGALSSISIKLW